MGSRLRGRGRDVENAADRACAFYRPASLPHAAAPPARARHDGVVSCERERIADPRKRKDGAQDRSLRAPSPHRARKSSSFASRRWRSAPVTSKPRVPPSSWTTRAKGVNTLARPAASSRRQKSSSLCETLKRSSMPPARRYLSRPTARHAPSTALTRRRDAHQACTAGSSARNPASALVAVRFTPSSTPADCTMPSGYSEQRPDGTDVVSRGNARKLGEPAAADLGIVVEQHDDAALRCCDTCIAEFREVERDRASKRL